MKSLRTLLIIEDDESFVEAIQEILYDTIATLETVLVAGTLMAGIEYLKENGIDLVLVDPGLPDARGLESIHRLRAQFPKQKLVILSARSDKRIASAAERLGVRYICKNVMAAGHLLMVPLEIRLILEELDLSTIPSNGSVHSEVDTDLTDFWHWRGSVETKLEVLTGLHAETCRNLEKARVEMVSKFDLLNNIVIEIRLQIAKWIGWGILIGTVGSLVMSFLIIPVIYAAFPMLKVK